MDETSNSRCERKPDYASENWRTLPYPSLVHTDKLSSLIEFPMYQSFKPEFNSKVEPADRIREDPQVKNHELDQWNDPFANQLVELVLSNLQVLFRIAIKRNVEFGYCEDVVEKALSRKGLYMVEGDPVSNIVYDTLNIMKGKQAPNPSDVAFESFQQMANYTLVEMISVLGEVRPSLTPADAMWLLLICDFNMSQAFKMDHLSGFKEGSSASSSDPQSKSKGKASDAILFKNWSYPSDQNWLFEAPKFGTWMNSPKSQPSLAYQGVKPETGKSSITSGEGAPATIDFPASKRKLETNAKRLNRKEMASLRQRFLHSRKGRFVGIGGLVLESPYEILKSGSSSAMSTKIRSIDGTCQLPTNRALALDARDSTETSLTKEAKSISALLDTKTSTSNKKLNPKCKRRAIDKTFDENDRLILKLIPQVKELQEELGDWSDWVGKRVMQVTPTLIQGQTEFKTTRQGKRERELCIKDNKLLEENAMENISELDNAVPITNSQIESANSKARMLEAENSKQKKELSTSKLLAEKSVASIQQALEREQMTLKKVESLEKENNLLKEELEKEKRKLANLQQELDKEEKLKAMVEAKTEKEREEIEACANVKEETNRKKAAADMDKYVEQIASLEKELVALKLKSDSVKNSSTLWEDR